MAFFKFRSRGSQGDEQSAGPAHTIDGLRRRARHRLIGAALLVLVGVVGFPLLFDTQPRPIAVDIPIDIPDKAKVKPLTIGGADAVVKVEKPVSTSEPSPTPAAKETPVSTESSLDAKEEVVAPRAQAKPEKTEKSEKPVVAKAEAKPDPKAEARTEAKAEAKAAAHKAEEDAAKAKALLEGKGTAQAGSERFIVQVGAFADAGKAGDARQKLEHAGLKTYTQVVDTKDGPRTRVRVGPFTSKSEADKAASKIKALDLSASILAL